MIKRLLIGAALGVLGKKFYDEGKLDPYIAKAKGKLGEQSGGETSATKQSKPSTTSSNPS